MAQFFQSFFKSLQGFFKKTLIPFSYRLFLDVNEIIKMEEAMKKFKFPKLNIRKVKKKWIIGGVVVLLVIIAGVRFITFRSRMKDVNTNAKMNTTVSTSTIQTSVSGTGTISYADTTSVVVPSDLTVDELLISEGSNVTAGDLIATVDEASLALCLNEVEEAIAEVDDTISSESSSSTSQSIKAGVAGRVKKIYADEDDSVVDIMKEQGALMLLSADDLMMVTLEGAANVAVGDEVTVSSGDTSTEGTVESVSDSGTVITFDDSVFAYEEEVTVTDSEENSLGTGKAYIHQMIKVVGSNGTISSLNVSLNSTVSASTKVFTLDSSAKSAEYLQAVKEREQLVDLLNTLIAIQANGGITAPVDGMLETVNTSSSGSSTQSSSSGYMMGAADASDNSEDSSVVEFAQGDVEQEVSELTETTGSLSEKDDLQESVSLEMASSSNITQMSTSNILSSSGTVETTKTAAEAPTGLTGGAGVINGTTTDMEYAVEENATVWMTCTAEKTVVDAGTWYVRMKETDTMAASAAVKVEVTAAGSTQQNTDTSQSQTSENSTEQNGTNQENTTEQNNVENPSSDTETSNEESGNSKDNNGKTSDNSSETKSGDNNTNSTMAGSGASTSRSSGSSSTSSSTSTTTSTSSLETTDMFTIANGDKMMVTMSVDELDIGTMQVGQEAEITLDAIEGETFTGTITSVSGSASSSGGSSQYPVEITFDKTDAMLTGMNASVEVIVEQAENVLVVPLSAVQDDGNYSYVYTSYDESSDQLGGKVEVTLGLSDETNVEVTAGLSEGDTIYYEMQGSEDSTSNESGMGGFSMPGGMGNMPSGGDFPGGSGGERPDSGNRGQKGGMGGQ